MNPLRQERTPKPDHVSPLSISQSTISYPVNLSIATLKTEISESDKSDQDAAVNLSAPAVSKKDVPDEFWVAWHSHKEYLIKLSMVWMNVSPADAEDAFSDATIRAYEKYAAHAAQISNERAWFARLLHNICIDKHRANKRVRNLHEKVKEINVIDMSALDTFQLTPEGNLLNAELSRRLRAAIEALPDRLKSPVVLRLVQGEEYDDIARKLGISNDNVRKRVQQGRSLLRENLKSFRGE